MADVSACSVNRETVDFENSRPQSSVVIFFTRRVDTPWTTLFINARTSALETVYEVWRSRGFFPCI